MSLKKKPAQRLIGYARVSTQQQDLARQIKAQTPELPVILISAVNEIPADAANADLFMSKLDGPIAMCENISAMLARAKRGSGNSSTNGSSGG